VTVPPAVVALPADDFQAFGWTPEAWRRDFPTIRWDSLPQERLGRDTVQAACATAAESPEAARRGFMVAMAWGYGNTGHGRSRVRKVIDQSDAPS
jgi:hypothetical protein